MPAYYFTKTYEQKKDNEDDALGIITLIDQWKMLELCDTYFFCY